MYTHVCGSRDSSTDLILSRKELDVFIEALCIKQICYN